MGRVDTWKTKLPYIQIEFSLMDYHVRQCRHDVGSQSKDIRQLNSDMLQPMANLALTVD